MVHLYLFECKRCVEEHITFYPCIYGFQSDETLKEMRADWRKALRRCPFEDTHNDNLTGNIPIAKWKRIPNLKKSKPAKKSNRFTHDRGIL